MTIHLSDKYLYRENDTYARKMTYTTSIFGATEEDYERLRNNAYVTSQYKVWKGE